jgi:uncharacterized membrane protein YkoI
MKLATLLLCVSLMTAVAPAWAAVSRDEAAAIAQRQTGGRVLSVERSDAGGRSVWRVKVLTKAGEVRVIMLDATTGR